MVADETIRRILSFIEQVEHRICKPLEQTTYVFPTAPKLVNHLRSAHKRLKGINSVKDCQFSNALNELRNSHNEACVALELIQEGVDRLDYEWQVNAGSKTIDFRVQQGHTRRWVEVKTIHPEDKDSWENYERLQKLLPDRVYIHLSRDWLGAEIWHHKIAARAKMRDYSLETEGKIASLAIDVSCEAVELWFCGNGFKWRKDELEDFVAFYLTGHHHPGDPFAKMEKHYLKENRISLLRTISRFGYLPRPDSRVLPTERIIRVMPPAFPR